MKRGAGMMSAMRRSSGSRHLPLHALTLCSFSAAALGLIACGSGSSSGTSASGKPIVRPAPEGPPTTFVLPGADSLGYLAVAPVPTSAQGDDFPYWIPSDDSAAILMPPADAPQPKPGIEVLAVPSRGAPVKLVIGERRRVRYGCDDNSLEGFALGAADPAAAPPPGPVWILPATPLAATWKPSGLEVAPVELAPDKRAWTVGPLRIALTVRDKTHATLAAAAGPVWVLQRELERPLMAGAPDGPLDLTQDVPGMPTVAAAFSMIPDGPILIVLSVPGYEGTTLTTFLYDGANMREVETMQHYFYACAF